MRKFILTFAMLLCFSPAAFAETWASVAGGLHESAVKTKAEAVQTREIIKNQRAQLNKELSSLKTSTKLKQSQFDHLEKEYRTLLEREKELEEELATQAHELKTIEGTLRSAGKQARDLFHESLSGPEFPQREQELEGLLAEGRFMGLEGIEKLVAMYLGEMKSSAEIILRKGGFTGADGSAQQGDILRAGTFTAAYRTPEGESGFLRPTGDNGLAAVQGDPGWTISRSLNKYFEGESGFFPMDISNGAALQRLAREQKSFAQWLEGGGLLVWPIVLVGVVALLLVLERFYSLGRIRANSERNMEHILERVSSGKWQECRMFCDQKRNFPTCRIISHTLKYAGQTREVIENGFKEALLKELPMLERFLPTLSVLAGVAPLLGLLGTVTGMINTFQIITVYGTGDPRMMSGGISEALVTTQLGLAVAVPIMLLHHILDRRVDKILGDIEEKGARFTVALMKNGNVPSGEVYHDAA